MWGNYYSGPVGCRSQYPNHNMYLEHAVSGSACFLCLLASLSLLVDVVPNSLIYTMAVNENRARRARPRDGTATPTRAGPIYFL